MHQWKEIKRQVLRVTCHGRQIKELIWKFVLPILNLYWQRKQRNGEYNLLLSFRMNIFLKNFNDKVGFEDIQIASVL